MPLRNQPQFDFIAGESSATFRESQHTRTDAAPEGLRAQVHKLQYELDSLKQDREVTTLRHQEELRSIQAKADADYKRAQASESSNHVASSKYDNLANELQQAQERAEAERIELERKMRTSQDEARVLQEQLEESQSELSSKERQHKHELKELDAKFKTAERDLEQVRSDRDEKATTLQSTAQKLVEQESRSGELENEIMRLKTQTGDADTLAVIKRELSEQVAHIQKLEAMNTDQRLELKQFRKLQKSVEVVEEEKRALENKVLAAEELRDLLNEAELRKQILEDEQQSWMSYLESFKDEDGQVQFETPEALAKAYMEERTERAGLTDKLGKISAELVSRDEQIQTLEAELAKLKAEPKVPKDGADATGAKARARLERQRALALKEVEYLRAQLKTFDVEESELEPEKYDESRASRIRELEDMVDQYRKEVQSMHDEAPSAPQSNDTKTNGTKRPLEEAEDERIGELMRKNRTLQSQLDEAQNNVSKAQKELTAKESQLKSIKSSSRTRILELRSNPTSNSEAVKMSTLNTLRAENAALLAQIEDKNAKSSSKTKQVPQATLDRLRGELEAKDNVLADKEKHAQRFKQIFAAKSKEFRQAVASMLGWNLDFLPNDRVRVTSIFYRGVSEEEGGEGKNSIVFDGDRGTMKVSGGPQSAFAQEIRSQIEYWVDGRKEIPCFLAALTLEFYEKAQQRA